MKTNYPRRILSFALFALLFTACVGLEQTFTPPPPPQPIPNTFYIEPDFVVGPISPHIYGTNYGPWVTVPFDMWPYAETSGLTIIRFPGGEWGDMNTIRSYQLDQLVDFANMMGADLSINVRLKNGDVATALDLMKSVENDGYEVAYWGIGNEPTLYEGALRESYDTERFNAEWREFALAMKEAYPDILLVGPEIHQFTGIPANNPKDASGRDWMTEFLKANGDLVDIVSFHRYPFPRSRDENATIPTLRENTQEWDATFSYLRELMIEHVGQPLPIAITEINSHYTKAVDGEATPDSFYNAIWWADLLGRFIQNDVHMVNHWMLTSLGGQGGAGLIGRSEVRPTYYVYQLYQRFGTDQVYASSDDSYVTTTAALREDGTLTIMLVNLTDSPVTRPIQVGDAPPSDANVWLLDADHMGENLGVQPIGDTITLPAQSVTLLEIKSSEE